MAHVALGQALREERQARGLTQQELADRSGLTKSYVSDVERGERNVTFENLLRLVRGTGVRLSSLLAKAEEHGLE